MSSTPEPEWTEEDTRPPYARGTRFAPFNAFVDNYATIKVDTGLRDKDGNPVYERLKPVDHVVFAILWRRANIHNICSITHAQIARLAGISFDDEGRSATVKRSLNRLRRTGFVQYIQKGTKGKASLLQLIPPLSLIASPNS